MKFSIDSWFWDKTSSWSHHQTGSTYANGWDYNGGSSGTYTKVVTFPGYEYSVPYMGTYDNRLDTLSNHCGG